MKLLVLLACVGGLAASGMLVSFSRAEETIARGAEWKFLKGRQEASTPDATAWRQLNFDDASWAVGHTPLFYGEPLFGTELTDMRGAYSSVFLRRKFLIENPAEISFLQIGAASDDGFIAWINGREVARHNVPEGNLGFNGVASGAVTEPIAFETYDVPRPSEVLVAGSNVITIQGFNASLGDSSDFVIDPAFSIFVDNAAPVVETIVPTPGSAARELITVEVHFDEAVKGLEAGDLLINGAGATNVVEAARGMFIFSFPQPADGDVSVAWRANHGITDLVGAAHPFAGGAWAYRLDSRSPAPGVYISEFMVDNDRTLNDEDGQRSDWIEIFNSGTSPASLNGWFLTDDAANLTKWTFPDVTVEPGAYWVVFASEKNRTNVTGRLHTNFKLSTDGEFLALVTPLRTIASQFAPGYPKQFTDVSYGRVEGTADTVGYFVKPTPGALNETSGPGFGPEVGFSKVTRTFVTQFDLTLSAAAANTTIRYTLDGNMPTNGSPVYLAPIAITNTMQVRARSFQEGLLPGPPRTESFLLLSNNVVNFVSDLPVVILHTMGKGQPTSSRQAYTHISVYEPVAGRAALTDPPSFSTRGAVKVRGSSTEGLPKLSFAMEFWDEFGVDSNKGLLGMSPDSDWVLYAPNQYEPVLIHNPFIHQLSRDMGRYSPRTRFVEVYVNRTGGPVSAANYNGIYVLEEKISIGKNRVNIDKLKPENLAPPEVTGGFLLKIDRLDPGDGGLQGGGVILGYVDPKEREIELPQRDPQEQYIKKYFIDFAKALAGPDFRDPVLGYPAFIDVDSWIDFHVLEVLSGNVDTLVLSTYFHKPRNGKIVFGPHWDFDRALGSTDGRDTNPRTWNTGPFFSSTWWSKMFTDRDFWQKWVDRWQLARAEHFSNRYINTLIDQQANEIRQAQPRERARWRIVLRGGSFQSEVDRMKLWLSNRIDYIDRQLAQPPVFSAPGGQVTPGFTFKLEAAAGATVYYTLDGTDPRLAQHEISPKALAYSGPIAINQSARVTARTRNPNVRQTGGPPAGSTTPWSAPVTVTFTVAPPPLAITEIMFHPENPASGSPFRDEDFEFIEIKNVGASPVSLPGYQFTSGIRFNFTSTNDVTTLAPGERALLVKNRTAFAARYPAAGRIAGEFEGTLSNAGNRVTLVGPLREPVADLTFDAARFPLGDGPGFSLVPADETAPAARLNEVVNWRISSKPGGSPGGADPEPLSVPAVLVNELLPEIRNAQDNRVELLNTTGAPVNVSGWYLTDNFTKPRKYRIPSGTFILPNGYLVLSETSFTSGDGAGFSFSAEGDEIYLFSADAAGNLTGWFHGFGFGAASRGSSFGRHVNSAGTESFVVEAKPSLSAANTGPRVGPIVISEINYEPPLAGVHNNTGHEFIELCNISAQPVPVFDTGYPASTWRLRGQVNFDFPPGLVLPAGAALLLVSFDPGAYPWAAAEFRARLGVDGQTTLLGPWTGHLDNAGGAVRLVRPAPSALAALPGDGDLPYEVVDEIDYSSMPPWPSDAAGLGRSLTRRDDQNFGNDPANWLAAVPSPGDADADTDGLPDQWERNNGLKASVATGEDGPTGDPDGDGLTNRQELLAGTLPQDRTSRMELRGSSAGPGLVTLTFVVPAGRSYTLQVRDNFNTGTWQPVQSVLGVPGGGTASITDSSIIATKYYRLVLP